MRTLLQDLRYALRAMAKSPGFTAVAVLTLALGIGANTAIFSVVRGVLLKPLPYRDPQRLVALNTYFDKMRAMGAASYPDMVDWRARNTVFEEVGGTYPMDLAVSGGTHPEHVDAAAVTAGLLPLLGVRPEAGRLFVPEDDRAGGRSVIVGHGFWQQVLGGRKDAVGSTLRLNGRSFTVIGILPAGFRLPIGGSPAQIWLSAAFAHESSDGDRPEAEVRGAHFMDVFARLRPGVTRERAQSEMSAIGAALRKEYPETNALLQVRVSPAADPLVRRSRSALTLLLAAVGVVLLIACANAANLVLARAVKRRGEITLRAAIGASRGRIVAQLLTESLALALLGGGAGALLAAWAVPALVAASGGRIPRSAEITLDGGVLLFTLGLSLATGVLFGLVPALACARPNLADALRDRDSSSTGRRGLRSALVISEVALAFVLLAGAGLLLRSLARVVRVDPGFDPRHVLTARLDLPGLKYPDAARSGAAYAAIVDELRRAPGILASGAVMPLPLSGFEDMIGFALEPKTGPAPPAGSAGRPFPWEAAFAAAEPGYFRTLSISLREGREFTRRDSLGAPPVAIVNESLARQFFPGGRAVGRMIRPSVSPGSEKPVFREIVGVVADVKLDGLREAPRPTVYVPEAQTGFNSIWLVVKSSGDDAAAIASLRRVAGGFDSELPVYAVQPLSRYVADSLSPERFNTLLISLFAGLALALTGIGLFGVVSYTVSQRTREIGVRIAIGARPSEVFGMVVRSGMRLVLLGIVAGLAASLLLGRAVESFLFGVGRADPATLAAIAAILGVVGVLACVLPARRAVAIDPLEALRYQ